MDYSLSFHFFTCQKYILLNTIYELAAVSEELGKEKEKFAQYATQNPLLDPAKLNSLEEYSKKLEPTVLKLIADAQLCIRQK